MSSSPISIRASSKPTAKQVISMPADAIDTIPANQRLVLVRSGSAPVGARVSINANRSRTTTAPK
jgi:hypothetical protein